MKDETIQDHKYPKCFNFPANPIDLLKKHRQKKKQKKKKHVSGEHVIHILHAHEKPRFRCWLHSTWVKHWLILVPIVMEIMNHILQNLNKDTE